MLELLGTSWAHLEQDGTSSELTKTQEIQWRIFMYNIISQQRERLAKAIVTKNRFSMKKAQLTFNKNKDRAKMPKQHLKLKKIRKLALKVFEILY